jgi:thioredoxin-related protein
VASVEEYRRSRSKISWQNIESGLKQANRENKPIVVDFYTNWCHWCKVMDEKTYSSRSVIRYASRNLIMVKVNAESSRRYYVNGEYLSSPDLAKTFGVSSYPNTTFLLPDGRRLDAVSGYIPPEKFLPILKYIGDKAYKEMTFEQWLKKRRR